MNELWVPGIAGDSFFACHLGHCAGACHPGGEADRIHQNVQARFLNLNLHFKH